MSEKEVREKLNEIHTFFEISEDSPSDPIAKKPTQEQLEWAAKVAAAQERLVRERELDSVSYYCHGRDDETEEIQSGFIVGFSLLNAAGIACAGEGDIKTALAMKIADLCGKGGSFCEIVAADFNRNTIIPEVQYQRGHGSRCADSAERKHFHAHPLQGGSGGIYGQMVCRGSDPSSGPDCWT